MNPMTVLNETRGYRIRFKQAMRAVENCAAEWTEFGVSIRDLNLAESIAARNEQAKLREPLPYSEIHGLKYEPTASATAAYRQGRLLAYEATLFAGLATSPRTAP